MIRPGIRRLFRLPIGGRRSRERDLEAEIELHLEMRVRQLVERGLTREAALAEARRRFGPEDEVRRLLGRATRRRDARLRAREWLGGVGRDLRHAGRRLRRRPGFALVVILTVAVGVGTTTAVFGVVEAVLLRPLPYPEADRVHYLWERGAAGGTRWVSAPNFLDWRRGQGAFEPVAALSPGGFNASGTAGPERVSGAEVTPEFFSVLGVTPSRGRGFLASEGVTPTANVAVISHDLWRRQFGGGTGAIGGTLELDGVTHTVVGVLPSGAAFPAEADVWVPLDLASEDWKTRRGIGWLNVMGRLRPGVSPEAGQRELDRLAAAQALEHPDLSDGFGIASVPLLDELVGDIRLTLLFVAGAVGLVLLVVCVNVAGLFLIRSGSRRKEAAIRRSIGGGRGHLVRQSLTETIILCGLGGLGGVALADRALRSVRAFGLDGVPRLTAAEMSGPVLLVGLGAALLTALLAGLVPAVRESRTHPRDGLAVGAPGSGGRDRSRRVLVAAQVALAVVLVAGAAHLLQTFRNLAAVDPGFRSERVLTAWLPLSESRYEDDAAVERFYRDILLRLRPLPAVARAGVVSALPLGPQPVTFSFELRDPAGFDEEDLLAGYQSASEGYFEAVGIPLLDGRGFREGEGASDPPVVVVDQAFVDRFLPGVDPLDQEILAIGDSWRRIVGVVGSVRRRSIRSEPEPMFYVPLGQDPRDAMTLVVQANRGEPASLATEIRRVVREVDPQQPVAALAPLGSLVGADLSATRFTAMVLTVFGAATLFLAMLGVYGALSLTVSARTREFGIRAALGAGPRRVRWLVLRQGLGITAAGLVVGIAAAVPAVRLARGLLYGVSPFQAAVTAVIVLVLIAAAGIASWLPAARATRLDPALSLRRE